MKKLVIACVASLLLMSWEAASETSPGASPERTRQSLNAHMTALKSLIPNLQGVAVDRASGVAVLTVFASTGEDANALAEQSSAEKLIAVPVRINVIGARLTHQP